MVQLIQWSLFALPLLSLFFIGKENLKRYMPVALFVTVINTLFYQAAYHFNWWREKGIFSWDQMIPVHWIYCAYLAATLWIFRFTYGRFWLYLLVNLLLDGGYTYLWYPIQQQLGLAATDITMSPLTTYALMTGVAIVIYGYQIWQESIFKEKTERRDQWRRLHLHRREKAR